MNIRRDTGILTGCLVEQSYKESVEWEAPGDAGVKTVKRENEAVGQRLQWIRELGTAGSFACQQ